MSSSSKRRKHYFWPCLLFLTTTACILLLYISHASKGENKGTTDFSDLPATHSEKLTDDFCPITCFTKECLRYSNLLINTVKLTVDPCQNFYEYACGNYNDEFGEDEVDSIITRNHRRMVTALKDVLDNLIANPGTASWKLKAVYDSCMKPDSENEAQTEALKFISELGIGPDWPYLAPDFKFQNTNIAIILGKLLAYDECPVMKMNSINNKMSDKGNKNITITLHHKLFYERRELPPVRIMFMRILEEFGLSSEESTEELWAKFLRIHIAMHRLNYITSSRYYNEDIQVSCLGRSDTEWENFCEMLKSFMNETNWSNHFNKNVANISRSDIHFVKYVVSELKQFNDRDVANYLAIHFFWTHGMDISFSFRLYNWKKALEVKPFQPPKYSRWEYCVNWLAENMYVSLGHEFSKSIIPEEAFDEIITIVDEHVKEIVKLISEQEWITESVKEAVMKKIGNITFSTNLVMENIFNETIVNEAYQEFNFTSGNYFRNILEQRSFAIWKNEEFFKEVDEQLDSPFEMQAETNDYGIGLMFGMLFPPVYLYGLERLVNLITLGNTISHEIGHYLPPGYYFYRDEADNRTLVDFEERVFCLINKYSDFKFDSLDLKMPGEKYQSESFSDAVSIAVIDKLIEKYASRRFSIPGSSFTTEQLLYISYSQVWCSKSSPEEDKYYFTHKYHPPSRYRAIAQIQSSKKFATAFNCPKGSYMNPVTKCFAFD